MSVITTKTFDAVTALQSGGVLAYPTESVYGIGCVAADRIAVQRIVELKQRSPAMGLITLITDLEQVETWLDSRYSHLWDKACTSWPDAITWLFPCSDTAPVWLTGGSSKIALRSPAYSLVRALCEDIPIVSTSANPSQLPAAQNSEQVLEYFPEGIDTILVGECGGRSQPSQIIDLISDKIKR